MVKKLYLEVRVPFSLGKKDNKLWEREKAGHTICTDVDFSAQSWQREGLTLIKIWCLVIAKGRMSVSPQNVCVQI